MQNDRFGDGQNRPIHGQDSQQLVERRIDGHQHNAHSENRGSQGLDTVPAVLEGADPEQIRLMAERVILVNPQDHIVGPCTKVSAHLLKTGLPLHRAFSVFLFDSRKRMLIQQRASTKVTFPNYWANACCSHPLFTDQELGIIPPPVQTQHPVLINHGNNPQNNQANSITTPTTPGSQGNFNPTISSTLHHSPHPLWNNLHALNHDHGIPSAEVSPTAAGHLSSNNATGIDSSNNDDPIASNNQNPQTELANTPGFDPNDHSVFDPVLGVKRAALRKLTHELGIQPGLITLGDLHFMTRIHYRNLCSDEIWGEHELDYVLFCCKDVPINPDRSEVQATRYVSEAELRDLFRVSADRRAQQPVLFSPWFTHIVDAFGWTWWKQLLDRGPRAVQVLAEDMQAEVHRFDNAHLASWSFNPSAEHPR